MKLWNLFKKNPINSLTETKNEPKLNAHSQMTVATDIGIDRLENEDYTVAGTNHYGDQIFLVCDGLGGYEGGKEAATILGTTIVAQSFKTNFRKLTETEIRDWFVNAVNEAKFKINSFIAINPEAHKMASTLVLGVLTKEKLYCFNIGDSRIFGIQNQKVVQISKDHNFYNYLLDSGLSNEEVAAYGSQVYAIVNYVGQFDEVEVKYDLFVYDRSEFDWVFCTSDGIHNFIELTDFASEITSGQKIEVIANNIIKKALAGMSNDNLSIALVNVKSN
ncbi:serine/threonine protein phosphatase PrpC [Mycoplasmoides fastidiosum]|uniref:Serine/threonine protein phosphatase PrpC n=1 Tax=Mycoplasmoides fastidiosum TaxID=92758 RepID=A0ABU0LZY6_9BACT|nr:PP2C family serine/threonine-protein phosphatase [Mycoplasmoides fastidiosum]MDQ0514268.1 serine/threonine protein phosphatase PrpC [Mycoplasmoides fastidiosum]UUD37324.1 serine/threonine-protein phosphatase [Mycoplasmoides fastidiosum]